MDEKYKELNRIFNSVVKVRNGFYHCKDLTCVGFEISRYNKLFKDKYGIDDIFEHGAYIAGSFPTLLLSKIGFHTIYPNDIDVYFKDIDSFYNVKKLLNNKGFCESTPTKMSVNYNSKTIDDGIELLDLKISLIKPQEKKFL